MSLAADHDSTGASHEKWWIVEAETAMATAAVARTMMEVAMSAAVGSPKAIMAEAAMADPKTEAATAAASKETA